MAAIQTKALPKGMIAAIVEGMVPIVNWVDQLGLRPVSMTATSLAIQTYQRHLSPRKGFSCAHRRLYGEVSCSEYFRQAVLEYGFSQAVPLFQQRLAECREANFSLRQLAMQSELGIESDSEGDEGQPRSRRNACDRHCNNCGDCGDLANCDWNFGACDRNHNGAIDGADCGGIDLTPDCGGADCGGADLGGCDVGGCDVGGCDCSV
jgi:putative component of membrane protein insertase Oxa1/YidC/SpoIIIJ protein YidD